MRPENELKTLYKNCICKITDKSVYYDVYSLIYKICELHDLSTKDACEYYDSKFKPLRNKTNVRFVIVE